MNSLEKRCFQKKIYIYFFILESKWDIYFEKLLFKILLYYNRVMNSGLLVFENEFRDYVLSLSLSDGDEISFGNHEYDYSLSFVGGVYNLFVYDVALDHYGMPYRNVLSFEVFDISYILK